MQKYTLEIRRTLVSPNGNRYPIGNRLGQGSFGSVREAGPGKIMKIIKSPKPSAKKHLLEEITIQQKLNEKEPDVCPTLYEYGHLAEANEYIIVMERCDGTVRNLLRGQSVAPEDVLDYYEQVAKILQRLEPYEFNHRDLKSDNVMYKTDPTTGKRKFLLIDFGFACLTVDGTKYQGTNYFKPTELCFRRSRDLAALVFESMHYLSGEMLTFAQLVLTFTLHGKPCNMAVGCRPLFHPATWLETYDFLNRPDVENPNTTPEGLLKAVEAYRQGGLAACRAGFITNPITGTCVPVPPPPAASALKLAVSPKPHVASPAVVVASKKKRQTQRTKPCPPGKELNPKTKRCIKKKEAKDCPPGKVRNPKTGRCIKETH